MSASTDKKLAETDSVKTSCTKNSSTKNSSVKANNVITASDFQPSASIVIKQKGTYTPLLY